MELKEDRLTGAKEIAEFIGEDERRTFYLLERKCLPAFKEGGRWTTRKTTLIKHYEKKEAGALEPEAA